MDIGSTDSKSDPHDVLALREYYNVEDRFREVMIDYETTQIVVSDLDKYYNALDSALLRYHGMKINVRTS